MDEMIIFVAVGILIMLSGLYLTLRGFTGRCGWRSDLTMAMGLGVIIAGALLMAGFL